MSTPRVDALMAKWDDDGAARGSAFCELRDLARELEEKRAALHPEQIADLATRCGVKGSAAALAEFAALVREAEPMAPDEMRPTYVVSKQDDLEEALACVLSAHTTLGTDGIDECVPRMVAMIPAAALPFDVVPTEGIDPVLYKPAPIENAEYLSKRLARVAKLAGVRIPEHFTHEQIAEVAPSILGEIARNLERAATPPPGATNVLKIPLTLRPSSSGIESCEVRDAADRVLATGFTPLEGSEAILRVNIHTELVSALRQAREALLNHVDVRVVAPAVDRVEGVLAKAGAM